MSATPIPLLGDIGAPELLVILVILVLLFGASKLPDLARGSGRALRIFKAETKGLMDDDEQEEKDRASEASRAIPPVIERAAPADPRDDEDYQNYLRMKRAAGRPEDSAEH